MISRLVLAATLGFAAPSAQAQEIAPERIDMFRQSIIDNGCRMTNEEAETHMPAAGFTEKDEVKAIVGKLMAAGEGYVEDGAFVLTGTDCKDSALGTTYSAQDRLMAALAFNDCSMTADESNTLLPPLGIERADVKPLVRELIRAETLSLSEDEQILTLRPELCSLYSDVAVKIAGAEMMAARDALAAQTASAGDTRQAFVAYMNARECSVSYDQLLRDIDGGSFEFDAVHKVLDMLDSEGALEDGENQDMIILNGSYCG